MEIFFPSQGFSVRTTLFLRYQQKPIQTNYVEFLSTNSNSFFTFFPIFKGRCRRRLEKQQKLNVKISYYKNHNQTICPLPIDFSFTKGLFEMRFDSLSFNLRIVLNLVLNKIKMTMLFSNQPRDKMHHCNWLKRCIYYILQSKYCNIQTKPFTEIFFKKSLKQKTVESTLKFPYTVKSYMKKRRLTLKQGWNRVENVRFIVD